MSNKKVFVVGSINMDLVVVTKKMPRPGETLMGDSFFTNPGGKGANQAVTIAKMGNVVEMVGAVGHEFGEELIDTLKSYDVSTKYVRRHNDVSSGTATIIVTNGDNQIILHPASNFLITKNDIDEALASANVGDFLLCQLEIPVEIVEYAILQAKAKGMITFLNPAPSLKLNENIFGALDYFMPNQSETEFYTGLYPLNVEQAKKAAQKLITLGVKNVVITLGDGGAYYFDGKAEYYKSANTVATVDTTGAGDTYIGTFLTMIVEGKPVREAMEYANKAASITIQRMGAQQAIPYRKELG